jgi:hypothetical protein
MSAANKELFSMQTELNIHGERHEGATFDKVLQGL